jgi:serine-type D-Ala-D-Ala carboxypeptidase (penicillin-binding protein 5/6)
LRVGAQGQRVEMLQRALNERLKPAVELSVDGEFGPVTRAAVIAWQKSQELAPTGEIGLDAWKKLGLAEASFQPGK